MKLLFNAMLVGRQAHTSRAAVTSGCFAPIANPTTHLAAHLPKPYPQALFDATGGLWASGALVGKPVATFCSGG